MIIDYNQNKSGVDISYVNDDKEINIINVPLVNGYYKYVKAEEFEINDINIISNLRSFKERALIKREPAKYFNKHNINEFLNREIKESHKEIYEKTNKLIIPNPYSVDIETDITDETGYSTPEKAENRILSISVTGIGMDSIQFVLKNPEHPVISDMDKMVINSFILNALGPEYKDLYDFNFEVRVFDTEVEMLNVFFECMNKYFHSIFGWNFDGYDWVYIYNRCLKLGIDMRKASPTFKLNDKIIKSNKKGKEEDDIRIKVPAHRLINDYMKFFKTSLIYNNLGSYSLNSIAESILGLKKIMYSGNLRSLYRDDYLKFIAYAFIDTILVMLIHKKTNLYDVDFFESYFNGIAYAKISQNSISEALVYNELREENIFLLESEFNSAIKVKYEGGYVKKPTQKIIEACLGIDFSGLYPNSIITMGISPERKIDKININAQNMPLTQKDMDIWLKYKAQNCTLTPNGTIYSLSDGDGLYVRIEKKLIAQRKVFKGHAEEIYIDILTKIENRITELQTT